MLNQNSLNLINTNTTNKIILQKMHSSNKNPTFIHQDFTSFKAEAQKYNPTSLQTKIILDKDQGSIVESINKLPLEDAIPLMTNKGKLNGLVIHTAAIHKKSSVIKAILDKFSERPDIISKILTTPDNLGQLPIHISAFNVDEQSIHLMIDALKNNPASLEEMLTRSDLPEKALPIHYSQMKKDLTAVNTMITALKDQPNALCKMLLSNNRIGDSPFYLMIKNNDNLNISKSIQILKEKDKTVLYKLLFDSLEKAQATLSPESEILLNILSEVGALTENPANCGLSNKQAIKIIKKIKEENLTEPLKQNLKNITDTQNWLSNLINKF